MEMGPVSKGLIELMGEDRVTIYPVTHVTGQEVTHEEDDAERL